MNITGWSNVHGRPGTSSNLSAIAIYSTLKYGMKNLITQSNFAMNDLEAPLLGNIIRENDYFQDIGIDALARSIKSAPLTEEAFYLASLSLLNKKLSLIPGTTKSNLQYFESDMEKVMVNIIKTAEKYYDLVYIDTNSGKNGLSMKILEKSDLIIVNLSQNRRIIDNFFDEYNFDPNKVFYLVGNYDSRRKSNIMNLRRQYRFMNSNNSAVIPYCAEFADAISEGNVIEFMKRNIDAKKDDKNYYFMECLAQATRKILKKAGWKGESA